MNKTANRLDENILLHQRVEIKHISEGCWGFRAELIGAAGERDLFVAYGHSITEALAKLNELIND